MKTLRQSISAVLLLAATLLFTACIIDTGGKNGNGGKDIPPTVPDKLNLSVFLDLSDRITRPLTPSQMSRDTAIVGYLADYFKAQTQGQKILQSENCMRVIFYPTPNIPTIAAKAAGLNVDMETMPKSVERRVTLEALKKNFQENLSDIYQEALTNQNYPGCDIWDFFSSKKVDTQCVREGYRNVLVILTDGYLFDAGNMINDGQHGYSYILPQTLTAPDSHLIAKRDGLSNLEVLILEVNPYTKEQGYKLIPILEKWLEDMGVSKEHITIAETDLPTNTKPVIDKFLKETE